MMNSLLKLMFIFFITTFALSSGIASAGVSIGGTRVIYDAKKKEANITVSSPEKDSPYLIQSWLDNIYPDDSNKIPFIITPPLFRLDPGSENVLRIVRAGGTLPDDRETVYWLNIKSIPSSRHTEGNQLQIAVKTRIKLFYRPATLKTQEAEQAWSQLSFSIAGKALTIANPTPFYVSLYGLKVGDDKITDNIMVPPLGKVTSVVRTSANTVAWQAITDYGGITPIKTAAVSTTVPDTTSSK